MRSLFRSCLRLVVLIVVLVGCTTQIGASSVPTPALSPSVEPTEVVQPTLDQASVTTPTFVVPVTTIPVWRGVIPGQTTRAQAIKLLGQSTIVQSYQNIEVLNYYPHQLESFLSRSDIVRVVLQNDIVQLIIVGAGEDASLSEIKNQYGEPEAIKQYSRPGYGDVHIFTSYGIAAEAAGEQPGGLRTVEYFVPMTLDKYEASWGQYHPKDKPSPQPFPGHPMDIGFRPGESTKQDVLAQYGDPDYIDTDTQWESLHTSDSRKVRLTTYIYRVPLTFAWRNDLGGSAFVSFVLDEQEIVQLIHVRGNLHPENDLGDVIAKYGEPKWIYAQTGILPNMIPTVYFYPEHGVSIVAVSGLVCSLKDFIQSEWYYAPSSWEEYWSKWGAEPRGGFGDKFEGKLSEWKGFPE